MINTTNTIKPIRTVLKKEGIGSNKMVLTVVYTTIPESIKSQISQYMKERDKFIQHPAAKRDKFIQHPAAKKR